MAINFNKIANFFNGTALNQLAKNFTDIAEEFPKTLYRDGSNTMRGNLDMDGRRIINHGTPQDDNDLATLAQVREFADNITQGPPGTADNTYTSYAALLASDKSRRSARLVGDPVEPDGVFSAVGGQWVRQKADSIAFTQTGAGSTTRPLADKVAESISVRDKGAVGNGLVNDTAAILLANDTATLLGKDLILPAGVYSVDAEIRATTNWIGEAGTIIKYRGNSPTFTRLVYASGVNGITFQDITFDGSVSADPTAWNSSNYDSFRGSSGLSVENCDRARLYNVRTINTRQHGIRLLNCTNPVIDSCSTTRSRGAFGDGFLIISCVAVTVLSSVAYDYTRIGFVVDSFGDTLLTCHKIAFAHCFASYGHDASALYGGGEFNAGYWFEHTGDVSMSSCFAFDNVHRGINICTGAKTNDFPGDAAIYSIDNCHTVGSRWGIQTYSLGNLPVISSVTNSSAKRAATAFEGTARNAKDSFTWGNCHGDYDASQSATYAFSCQSDIPSGIGKPSFHVGAGCTISRWAVDQEKLADDGNLYATADIGNYFTPNVSIKLTVDGVRNVDGVTPVYVRWYETKPIDFTALDSDIYISRGGGDGSTIKVKDCTIRRMISNQGNAALTEIKNNIITGQVTVASSRADFIGNSVIITDSSYVWFLSNATSKSPAVFISGNRFEKNISNGYALRLGFGTVSFQTIINGALFYNTGAASSTNAFVAYAAGAIRTFLSTVADSNVTNITMLDSGGGAEDTVPGVTKIAMH